MAPVLKTGIPERVSGVRIPPSPPAPNSNHLPCGYRERLPANPDSFRVDGISSREQIPWQSRSFQFTHAPQTQPASGGMSRPTTGSATRQARSSACGTEVDGQRKWETLTGTGITLKYALARAKMREADLLTGAINAAKNAPVVPIPAQPEKPVRLTIDQAIDRYLRNASTKSPRTLHGYTYTLKQFRVRVSCSAFVFEQSQAQPCLCSWSVRIGA
jgi:hypothetical protein